MLYEGEPEEEERYRMISEDVAEMGKILNAPRQRRCRRIIVRTTEARR